MPIIKVISNDTTKILEVAHVSNVMALAHLYAWRIDKPIKLDGVELENGAKIEFGSAVVEIDGQQKCEGSISLVVNKEAALLKCAHFYFDSTESTHVVNGRSGFGGSIGPFRYCIECFSNERFHVEVTHDILGVTWTLIDSDLDPRVVKLTGSDLTSKCEVGVDFAGRFIYFSGSVKFGEGYSGYLHRW